MKGWISRPKQWRKCGKPQNKPSQHISGWWLSLPLWKQWVSNSWDEFSEYMQTNKHDPNHQPVYPYITDMGEKSSPPFCCYWVCHTDDFAWTMGSDFHFPSLAFFLSLPVYNLFFSNSAYAVSCPKNPLRNQAAIFTFCQKRRTNARLGERHCFVLKFFDPGNPWNNLGMGESWRRIERCFPMAGTIGTFWWEPLQVLTAAQVLTLEAMSSGRQVVYGVSKKHEKTLTASPKPKSKPPPI